MKRTWTIIGVSDVPGSFKWYQALFGQLETRPAHGYFGQLLDLHGTVLLPSTSGCPRATGTRSRWSTAPVGRWAHPSGVTARAPRWPHL
jgi:hypothetical protein